MTTAHHTAATHHSATAHHSAMAHHMATAHPPIWPPIRDLFRGEEFASFQLSLEHLIPHLVLEVSQFFFLIQDSLGISLWIGP